MGRGNFHTYTIWTIFQLLICRFMISKLCLDWIAFGNITQNPNPIKHQVPLATKTIKNVKESARFKHSFRVSCTLNRTHASINLCCVTELFNIVVNGCGAKKSVHYSRTRCKLDPVYRFLREPVKVSVSSGIVHCTEWRTLGLSEYVNCWLKLGNICGGLGSCDRQTDR